MVSARKAGAHMSEAGSPEFGSTSRMETGEVLERWSRVAAQSDRNAVHHALFTIVDGSLPHTYRVVEDAHIRNELYVIVKDDLVMKLRVNDINDFSSFEILGIGPRNHFAAPHDGQPTS
jgi:hypothetical protein